MMIDDPSFSRHRSLISPSLSAPSFQTFTASSRRSPSPAPPTLRPSSSSSSTSRRPPSTSFLHNARIALSLAPAAAFLVSLGGTPVAVTLSIGLFSSYFLDSLRLSPTVPFFAVWFTVLASQLAFFLSASISLAFLPLTILALLFSALTNFLLGIWASLNFKWMQVENAPIVPALERLLFACLPIAAPTVFTWAAVATHGMSHAAYYHMAFEIVFYWLYALPRQSSFMTKQEAGGDEILGPLEGCVHMLHLLFGPPVFYLGSHYATVLTRFGVCDVLLLFFIPLLVLMYATTRGAMGWLTRDAHQMQRFRVVNGAIALVVVVICLEVRVVFNSFGKYLHASPQVSAVLVTVAMLGGASAVGAYAVGMVKDAVSQAAFTGLAMVVSAAGAYVVGFPFLLLPLPLISGFYLARFFTNKSLSSYFAFVVLGSSMILWFIVHNFWYLNIWMGGMPLKSICKLIFSSSVIAMAVPGFTLLPSKLRFLTELGLISHALLLCYIEDRFFNHTVGYFYGFEEDVMYPTYMVLTTTFLGLGLVRKLAVDCRIGPKAIWILTCLYVSKIAMLFITSKSVLWVSAVLLLAVSPPLLLYRDKSKGASKMKIWQGYAHAFVVAFSAWLCRETIFEALQWWYGRPPSDGLLLGFYILLTGIACIPIVALHFPHVQQAKRCLVLVVAMGLLFILMQPPIPLSWAWRSTMISSAHQSSDDISIYGFVTSKPTWPSWLLIATILLTLAAVTSIIPVKYIVELRAFYAVGSGITLGIYICAEYFLQSLMLYPLLVATIICASVFLVFTHIPSASSTRILPWVFALMVALFPVTYLLEGQLRAMRIEDGEEEVYRLTNMLAIEGARMSLLGLYAMLFMLIALEIKFELASIMREKTVDRVVAPIPSGRKAGFPPKLRLSQQRRASTTPSFTIKRLASEAAWMPAVGNVSTILCFSICLILNMHLTGGSNQAIFFLAPILLLLNQDSDIFAGFGDRQRYFPLTVVISGYLISTALYRIWEEVWHGNTGWGLEIGGPGWFFAVKNAALLVLTLPNHILFNRFMWDYVKQTDVMLLLTMPLNLPSIIITDIVTVRVLGLLGIIYSLAQYMISRRIRIAGMKYI